MKKKTTIPTLALLCATLLCGCTVTARVTSYDAFDKALTDVEMAMKKEGFELDKVEKSQTRELPIHLHSRGTYSPSEHGFNGSSATGIIYSDTYHFANGQGDTMRYTVTYRTSANPTMGKVYVTDVTVGGCETTKPAHRDRLCGEASPIQRLGSLEKDITTVL